MKFKHFIGLLFLLITVIAKAQTFNINGVVLNSKTNTGIPGVNISIKKTKTGVVTDLDGKYLIKVNNFFMPLPFDITTHSGTNRTIINK